MENAAEAVEPLDTSVTVPPDETALAVGDESSRDADLLARCEELEREATAAAEKVLSVFYPPRFGGFVFLRTIRRRGKKARYMKREREAFSLRAVAHRSIVAAEIIDRASPTNRESRLSCCRLGDPRIGVRSGGRMCDTVSTCDRHTVVVVVLAAV